MSEHLEYCERKETLTRAEKIEVNRRDLQNRLFSFGFNSTSFSLAKNARNMDKCFNNVLSKLAENVWQMIESSEVFDIFS